MKIKKIVIALTLLLCTITINNKVEAYEEYKVGDNVEYNGESYYVIKDSSSDEDYLVLLKTEYLTAEEVNKYNGGEYESSDGTIPYYSACDSIGGIEGKCITDYEESNLKITVENWAKDKLNEKDLVEINGYKVRLITIDDLVDNLKYQYYQPPTNTPYYGKTEETPELRNEKSRFSYWTMTVAGDSSSVYTAGSTVKATAVYDAYYVRPVINLKKCALNDPSCQKNNNDNSVNSSNDGKVCKTEYKTVPKYKRYSIGEIIQYNNENYLVIANSRENQNYVTLLKVNPLSTEEIDKYFDRNNNNNRVGTISWSNGSSEYDESKVKVVVDNWAKSELDLNDLVEVDGYKATLFDFNKTQTHVSLGYSGHDSLMQTHITHTPTDKTPTWFYSSNYSYWLKSNTGLIHMIKNNGDIMANQKYEYVAAVRPVINLSKTKAGNKETYNIGDVVTYKDIKFYVVENSYSSTNYVTLMKAEPLTKAQVSLYSGLEQNGVPYYTSDSCQNSNTIGCTTDYKQSNIKSIIDKWATENIKNSDLVEVNGYKVRLITKTELINNLGYSELHTGCSVYAWMYTEDTPAEVYTINDNFWTMDSLNDSNNEVLIVKDYIIEGTVYDEYPVRPVINLDKCSIQDGCTYERVEVENCEDDNPDESIIVEVGNTLKSPGFILLAISLILVGSGVAIIAKNYIKRNK